MTKKVNTERVSSFFLTTHSQVIQKKQQENQSQQRSEKN